MARPAYRDPEPGETAPSGTAIHLTRLTVQYILSCERCAETIGDDWIPGITQGECVGCGVRLV